MEELIATLVAKLNAYEPDQEIFDNTGKEAAESPRTLVGRLRPLAEPSERNSQIAIADALRCQREYDASGSYCSVRLEEPPERHAAEEIEQLRVALKKTCMVICGRVLTKSPSQNLIMDCRAFAA